MAHVDKTSCMFLFLLIVIAQNRPEVDHAEHWSYDVYEVKHVKSCK